jgi:hypothetical protein
MGIRIEISPAELFDRIGILEIKLKRLSDPVKLANVTSELAQLKAAEAQIDAKDAEIQRLRRQLDAINDDIWMLTDEVYRKRGGRTSDAVLVELCLRAFDRNRDRSIIKRDIDDRLGSAILEEKNYGDVVQA